jgi:hypothetical protein
MKFALRSPLGGFSLLLCLACSSAALPAAPDGAAGTPGADAQGGGGGGAAEAGVDATAALDLADARLSSDQGPPVDLPVCSTTAASELVMPACGTLAPATGQGAPMPDGRYELVSVTIGFRCFPGAKVGLAFEVKGTEVSGASAIVDQGIARWRSWRATVGYSGQTIIFSGQCGIPGDLGSTYTLEADGVTLFRDVSGSPEALRLRRL